MQGINDILMPVVPLLPRPAYLESQKVRIGKFEVTVTHSTYGQNTVAFRIWDVASKSWLVGAEFDIERSRSNFSIRSLTVCADIERWTVLQDVLSMEAGIFDCLWETEWGDAAYLQSVEVLVSRTVKLRYMRYRPTRNLRLYPGTLPRTLSQFVKRKKVLGQAVPPSQLSYAEKSAWIIEQSRIQELADAVQTYLPVQVAS